jgi:mannose-6-phosphate isomerase-like protein (cupin superfamily)
MTHTRRNELSAYTTKDGSSIREMMHPLHHGNRALSLAEATVAPGCHTRLHRHRQTEELYHVTAGNGVMRLGSERFEISVGDTVAIPAGTPHAVENSGSVDLVILCCCCPPYSHDDTELLEPA